MSDHAHDSHTGPIKTPAQLLWTSFFSFVAPVFVIIGLVYYVTSDNKPAAGAGEREQRGECEVWCAHGKSLRGSRGAPKTNRACGRTHIAPGRAFRAKCTAHEL